ncbi:MAG: hypothetical protein A2Y87_00170 [Bacteroidetes bacterium RBG_13_46_8]|nr:MAG: hypothetical protein A2Y87_00170 [Bacteroidetes bacterium RBG_13_46_8]
MRNADPSHNSDLPPGDEIISMILRTNYAGRRCQMKKALILQDTYKGINFMFITNPLNRAQE